MEEPIVVSPSKKVKSKKKVTREEPDEGHDDVKWGQIQMRWILAFMVLAMFAVVLSGCPDLRPYRATVSDVPAEDCGCQEKK